MTDQDQTVTPWEASTKNGKFNYQKLVEQFGVSPITPELISRFEKVTGKPVHQWLRRGIFFAHRQMDEILNDYEQGKQIFLYSGRGPSGSLTLAHTLAFMFLKWLQDIFNAIVVIQIADTEKFYFKDLKFDDVYNLGFENAKDIIAFGFNPDRTFIFSNFDYSRTICMQKLSCELMKKIHINQLQATFGIVDNAPVGQLESIIHQICASFSCCFEPIFKENVIRCLIIHGVDQDIYFRVARDYAQAIGSLKPCSLMCQFLPALDGSGKMSTTQTSVPTIFLNDTPAMIMDKVKKHAFSGGKDTAKEHREKGANLEVDIAYIYLTYFEEDDDKLKHVANEYGSGRMMTSEIKRYMSDRVTEFIMKHQEAKSKVTDEQVKYFYNINKFN